MGGVVALIAVPQAVGLLHESVPQTSLPHYQLDAVQLCA